MPIPTLTTPPEAPSRSGDTPDEFVTKADAFVAYIEDLSAELTAWVAEVALTVSGVNFNATSTTSVAIGTGAKSLTVQTGKLFQVGQYITIAYTTTPANFMLGQVTAYNSGTGAMTVEVTYVEGSGTYTAWSIGIAPPFSEPLTGSDFVTVESVSALSNKTIDLADNTLTGTIAEFNAACSDADFAPTVNPALTDPVITGCVKEDEYTISDGPSVDIDPSNGSLQLWTLGANRTPTATNFQAGESVTLHIADGTAYAVTWTTIGVVWVGGSAPTLPTTGYGVIELWKTGSVIRGAYVGEVAS